MDWDRVRKNRFAKDQPPSDWPEGVCGISLEGLNLLGVDEKSNNPYWDGKEVVLRTIFRLATFEKGLAIACLLIATGGLLLNVGRAAGWWK
jgi:hypothetical protein